MPESERFKLPPSCAWWYYVLTILVGLACIVFGFWNGRSAFSIATGGFFVLMGIAAMIRDWSKR